MRHLADGDLDQAVADAQMARLAAKRRAAQAELAAALAAQRGLRSATHADAVAEGIAALRRGAALATPDERRGIVRQAVATAIIDGPVIALDLSFDAATLVRGGHDRPDSTCGVAPVRHGLRVLGVAPRPQTYRPAVYRRRAA